MKRGLPTPLTVSVLVMSYLPLVAVMAVIGYLFGWKFPVVGALVLVFLWLRARWTDYRPTAAGRLRTGLELIAFSLLGSIVGGVLVNGVGAILGFAIGFVLRLGEIPITRSRTG
jgi:hypothetical protein